MAGCNNTMVGAGGLKQEDSLSPHPALGPPKASLFGLSSPLGVPGAMIPFM